MPYNIWIY